MRIEDYEFLSRFRKLRVYCDEDHCYTLTTEAWHKLNGLDGWIPRGFYFGFSGQKFHADLTSVFFDEITSYDELNNVLGWDGIADILLDTNNIKVFR